jgi:ribosomal protein S4
MTHRYILNLSWDTRNMAYMLLYSVFKHNINNIRTKLSRASVPLKRGIQSAKIARSRTKRIKNNQFNIKWFFNRYLKLYYQTSRAAHLYSIETRLDIILFRTNWFINKEAVRVAIKSGLVKVNNKIIHGRDLTKGHLHLKPGDIIKVDKSKSTLTTSLSSGVNKLWLTSHYKDKTRLGISSMSLYNWASGYRYNIIPNLPYLEVNNKIKALMVLKKPKFNEIPYPFNLRKFKA